MNNDDSNYLLLRYIVLWLDEQNMLATVETKTTMFYHVALNTLGVNTTVEEQGRKYFI